MRIGNFFKQRLDLYLSGEPLDDEDRKILHTSQLYMFAHVAKNIADYKEIRWYLGIMDKYRHPCCMVFYVIDHTKAPKLHKLFAKINYFLRG